MRAIGLALCVALAGCGGGGRGPAPSPVSQSAPIQSAPDAPKCVPVAVVKIQLFGDSTQWGFDGETQAQAFHNPTDSLQNLMNARFGVGAVKVEDRAVGGTTSKQLFYGTDGLNKPWPQSVDADITVMNFGVNDSAWSVPFNDYVSYLSQMSPTVFETPNLTTNGSPIDQYAQGMRDVAASLHKPVADVTAYMHSLPDWQSYVKDGVHPGDTLYALISYNVLYPTLEPLMAKLKCQ